MVGATWNNCRHVAHFRSFARTPPVRPVVCSNRRPVDEFLRKREAFLEPIIDIRVGCRLGIGLRLGILGSGPYAERMVHRVGNTSPRAAVREVSAGAHLRSEIQRLGLDQVELAQVLGVTRQTINNVINGRYPISRALAGKLGRLSGQRADYWLQTSFLVAPEPEARPASVRTQHEVELKKLTAKRPRAESFQSFVRKLVRGGAGDELVQRIGADKTFSEINNWGQLRMAVRKIDNSDDTFIAARRLWRQYMMR